MEIFEGKTHKMDGKLIQASQAKQYSDMTNNVEMGKEFKKETWRNVNIKMLRKHITKYVHIFLQNIR